MGDDEPVAFYPFEDNDVVALNHSAPQGHVIRTGVVTKIARMICTEAMHNVIVSTSGDGPLHFRQDRVMTMHRPIPAHQDSLGRIEGSDLIGMTGVEFLNPGVANLLDLSGKIIPFTGMLAFRSRCSAQQES